MHFNKIGENVKVTLADGSLPAGTSLLGKVGIDQTTDGTTNKVQAHLNTAGAAVTAANPAPVQSPGFAVSASQTRPANTTAYAAYDVVGTDAATNMEFASVGSVAGGSVIVTNAKLRIDVGAIPAGMGDFVLHLFNEAPTAITDNLAFNLIAADRGKYQGSITLTTPTDLGDTLWSQATNQNLSCQLASGSTTLYGVLVTVGAFTPTSACVKTVTINGMQC